MSLDADRWERIQALFHEALERPEAGRKSFLEVACEGDPALLEDVVALLAADADGSSVLDRGRARVALDVLGGSVPSVEAVGPYRIRQVLGEGGMGIVYLADRADLGTRAAIKMLRDAWLSPVRRERFASEQRMLAQLNHPSIARLYDADTLADGTPYFIMEYVEGIPLTEYCSTRQSTVVERLRLLRAVCEAVMHAHRQAVIHRDLKPSNILVTADGTVKLLDFGISKQLESLETPARQTQTVLRLMTPAYAAPEQILGEPIGSYTDVYALGVILYELLTGRLPFDLSNRTPGQVERLILDQEPQRPSLAAGRTKGEAADNLPAASVGKAARADLDVLCLTAMHKDPQRRYRTVEALARDLDHYLLREPLEARPDAFGYRAGKFLRRNWRTVAAASAVAVVVVGLVVFYTVRLATARDAALAEAARTQRIQRFMLSLFEGGDEAAGPADTLRVVTLIGRGEREASVLQNEPGTQAELYQTLGGIYQKLGDMGRADSLMRTALEQRRSLFGPDHPDVAASLVALGLLRSDQARLEESERLIREGLDVLRLRLPPEHPAVIEATTALGHILQERGDYDQSVAVLDEAVRLQAGRAATSPELSAALTALASTHFYAGNYATADSLFQHVLAMDRTLHGDRHPLVADGLINLGAVQFQRGNYSRADTLYRQAIEITQAYYGPDHHRTAANLTMLGRALVYQDRYAEALEVLRRALAIRERVYGPEHPQVASTINELGNVAVQQGDLATAEAYFTRMIGIYLAVHGEKHYLLGIAKSNLASAYMNGARYDRAEVLFREVLDLYAETLPADHDNTAIARIKLGRVLTRQQRYAEAEPEILAGYGILIRQSNPAVSFIRAARTDLVTVYEALNQPEQAARFRAELADTLAKTAGK